MTENSTQMEFAGLDRFNHLEDKILKVVDAFKAMRKEKESVQAENQKLKSDIESLRQNEAGFQQNLAQLQKEREALRERVEKALSLLATLEVR